MCSWKWLHKKRSAPTPDSNHQCLKVREIQYSDSGVKTYNTVTGCTTTATSRATTRHTPGVRNVLRINRYELKNVPADARLAPMFWTWL